MAAIPLAGRVFKLPPDLCGQRQVLHHPDEQQQAGQGYDGRNKEKIEPSHHLDNPAT